MESAIALSPQYGTPVIRQKQSDDGTEPKAELRWSSLRLFFNAVGGSGSFGGCGTLNASSANRYSAAGIAPSSLKRYTVGNAFCAILSNFRTSFARGCELFI